jgi:serine O-acetyltransferase
MNDKSAKIVTALLSSYAAHPSISRADCDAMPDRDTIIDIVKKLREILYPGYFYKQVCDVEVSLGIQIEAIWTKLQEQIYGAMMLGLDHDSASQEQIWKVAGEKTEAFLGTLGGVRDMLASDVQAAYEGDPAASSTDEVIFSYPGVFAITVHRIAHELHKLAIPLIPRIMSEYAHNLTGIDIHPGATIGRYFFIDHGTGVVIGETTHIGEHVKIYQGVTLGALSLAAGQMLRGTKRHPTLQNNVVVYAGASILGGETVIGEGTVIGGNVFITSSVSGKVNVAIKSPELQYSDKVSKRSKKSKEPPLDWMI